jgi:hypothetical protein
MACVIQQLSLKGTHFNPEQSAQLLVDIINQCCNTHYTVNDLKSPDLAQQVMKRLVAWIDKSNTTQNAQDNSFSSWTQWFDTKHIAMWIGLGLVFIIIVLVLIRVWVRRGHLSRKIYS